MAHEVRCLRTEDVVALAELDDYIEAVRTGYRQFADGGQTAPRTKLFQADRDGLLLYYGATLPAAGVMGVYQYVGDFTDGEAWSLTFLADARTGRPLATVDGAVVNPYKTGATGAVAVDALANEDAAVAGIIGTGRQAGTQLLATARVRDLDEVRVHSPTPAHRETFATELDDRLDAAVRPVESADEAVRGAEIVVTATTATDPVFEAASLAPGTHVTAMGQSHPDKRELDAETVARAVYVADHRERAEVASGELLGAIRAGAVGSDHVHAELGDVVAGRVPGRPGREAVTVFDSGGTAIETVAAAAMLYERARDAGAGVTIPMSSGTPALPGLASDDRSD